MSVRVDFSGNNLTERVYIESIAFRVRKYNLPPLRCYRCQRFGHMSSGCKKPQTCNICAGNHSMENCTATIKLCANCHGPHVASSGECQYNKDAVEIEKIRGTGIPFLEARRQVLQRKPLHTTSQRNEVIQVQQRNQMGIETHTIEANIHQTQGSYIQNNRRQYSQVVSPRNPQTSEEKEKENLEKTMKYIDDAIRLMTVKIISFLQEVFSIQMHKEQSKERKLLLVNMARHHFGTNIDPETIKGGLNFEMPAEEFNLDSQEELSQIIQTRSTSKGNKKNTIPENKGLKITTNRKELENKEGFKTVTNRRDKNRGKSKK